MTLQQRDDRIKKRLEEGNSRRSMAMSKLRLLAMVVLLFTIGLIAYQWTREFVVIRVEEDCIERPYRESNLNRLLQQRLMLGAVNRSI